jgi:hypothetical protein
LSVETQLITPEFAIERPQNVLFIRCNNTENLRVSFAHLTRKQLFVEQVALRCRDIDQDLLAVSQVFLQLLNEAAVPRLCEVSGIGHSDLTGFSQPVLDVLAQS